MDMKTLAAVERRAMESMVNRFHANQSRRQIRQKPKKIKEKKAIEVAEVRAVSPLYTEKVSIEGVELDPNNIDPTALWVQPSPRSPRRVEKETVEEIVEVEIKTEPYTAEQAPVEPSERAEEEPTRLSDSDKYKDYKDENVAREAITLAVKRMNDGVSNALRLAGVRSILELSFHVSDSVYSHDILPLFEHAKELALFDGTPAIQLEASKLMLRGLVIATNADCGGVYGGEVGERDQVMVGRMELNSILGVIVRALKNDSVIMRRMLLQFLLDSIAIKHDKTRPLTHVCKERVTVSVTADTTWVQYLGSTREQRTAALEAPVGSTGHIWYDVVLDGQLLSVLMAGLADDDASIAWLCTQLLVKSGVRSRRIVTSIMHRFSDKRWQTRIDALNCLSMAKFNGNVDDASNAIATLVQQEPRQEVRATAYHVMSVLKVGIGHYAVDWAQDRRETVRQRALMVLREAGDVSVSSLQAVVNGLADTAPTVRAQAVLAVAALLAVAPHDVMLEHGINIAALEYLCDIVVGDSTIGVGTRDVAPVRAAAALAMMTLSWTRNEWARDKAQENVALITRVMAALHAAADDPSSEVCKAARTAMSRYGLGVTTSVISVESDHESEDDASEETYHDDSAGMASVRGDDVNALLEHVRRGSVARRAAAVLALGAWSVDCDNTVQKTLLERLRRDPHEYVRSQAARGLSLLQPPPSDAYPSTIIEHLLRCVQSSEPVWSVRAEAVRALVSLAGHCQTIDEPTLDVNENNALRLLQQSADKYIDGSAWSEAMRGVLVGLADQDFKVCCEAAYGIQYMGYLFSVSGVLGPESDGDDKLLSAITTTSHQSRDWEKDRTLFRDLLAPLLHETHHESRHEALKALRCGEIMRIGAVLIAMDDGNDVVGRSLGMYFGSNVGKAEDLPNVPSEVVSDEADFRVVQYASSLLQDDSALVRAEAARLISDVRGAARDRVVALALARRMSQEDNPAVRVAIAEALGRTYAPDMKEGEEPTINPRLLPFMHGTGHSAVNDVLDTLTESLQDHDSEVRYAAARSLVLMGHRHPKATASILDHIEDTPLWKDRAEGCRLLLGVVDPSGRVEQASDSSDYRQLRVLSDCLRDENDTVRHVAACTLLDRGARDEVIKALLKQLQLDDKQRAMTAPRDELKALEQRQAAVCRTISAIHAKDIAIIKALEDLLCFRMHILVFGWLSGTAVGVNATAASAMQNASKRAMLLDMPNLRRNDPVIAHLLAALTSLQAIWMVSSSLARQLGMEHVKASSLGDEHAVSRVDVIMAMAVVVSPENHQLDNEDHREGINELTAPDGPLETMLTGMALDQGTHWMVRVAAVRAMAAVFDSPIPYPNVHDTLDALCTPEIIEDDEEEEDENDDTHDFSTPRRSRLNFASGRDPIHDAAAGIDEEDNTTHQRGYQVANARALLGVEALFAMAILIPHTSNRRVKALVRMLSAENSLVRGAAVRSIMNHCGEEFSYRWQHAVSHAVVERMSDTNADVRRAAVESVMVCGVWPPLACVQLLHMVHDGHIGIRTSALLGLASTSPRFIRSSVEMGCAQYDGAAHELMNRLDAGIQSVVLHCMNDASVRVRAAAIAAHVTWVPNSTAALTLVLKRLSDEAHVVRVAACEALGTVFASDRDQYRDHTVAKDTEIADSSWHMWLESLDCLPRGIHFNDGDSGLAREEVIASLLRRTNDWNGEVFHAAIQALSDIGVPSALLVRHLVDRLWDTDDASTRRSSVLLIASLNLRVEEAIVAVCRVLNTDAEVKVRAAAANAIGDLGVRTFQVIDAIAAALKNDDSMLVRRCAASAALVLGLRHRDVIEGLAGIVRRCDPDTSQVAERALESLGPLVLACVRVESAMRRCENSIL